MSWVQTVKLGLCFFTWFFLNVMYNITNKKCQNAFPMPWTMTFVSLAVGARRTRGRRRAHAHHGHHPERGGRPQYPKGGPAERYGQARPEKDAAGGISAPT